MEIRQSDLSSYGRCAQQKHLYDEARAGRVARPANLSRTVFGTVMHHALQTLERLHSEGSPAALETALSTFAYYWDPEHLPEMGQLGGHPELVHGIDEWLPRDSYGGMRTKGLHILRDYYEVLRTDVGVLLALELDFRLPIDLSDLGVPGEHFIKGTIDRLAIRRFRNKPYLSIEDFKGLALSTELPTPTGWTTMEAVQVGDWLMGADGAPCRVTAKSGTYVRDCYRVSFDDGSSLVADNVHLWQVRTDVGVKVLSTEELAANLVNPVTGQRHLRIDNAKPLSTPAAQLAIHPYALGVWLGDGTRSRGVVSKPDVELFDNLTARGVQVGRMPRDLNDGVTLLGMTTQLRQLGLLGNKHIPDLYARGSFEQRVELLRGLMDTDGCWHKGRERAVFTTCNERLADDVVGLVASLGWRPSVFKVQRHGFGITVDAWDVTFVPLQGVNPFALSRKASLVTNYGTKAGSRAHRRLIVGVDRVPSVRTACVQVDSPDSLYLAGRQMVPTHNTGKQQWNLRYNNQFTTYAWASLQREFWEPWGDEAQDRYELYRPWGRKGVWFNVQENKPHDTGWRGPQDFERMRLAVAEYVKANEREVFPLTLSGDTCVYCDFRNGTCGGIPVPDENHGRPA